MRALGRRAERRSRASGTAAALQLDPATHAIRAGDRSVPLTPTEFRLLAALVSRPGEVVRRRELVAAAWPDGAIVHENTLDTYVGRLRRKLRELGVEARDLDRARGRLLAAVKRLLIRDRVTLASVAVLAVGLAGARHRGERAAHQAAEPGCLGAAARAHRGTARDGRHEFWPDQAPRRAEDAALDRAQLGLRGTAGDRAPGRLCELQRAADGLVARQTDRRSDARREHAPSCHARVRTGWGQGSEPWWSAYPWTPTSTASGSHVSRRSALSLLVLVLGALVARRAVGAALRPVGDMAASAADWSEHDLGRRLDLGSAARRADRARRDARRSAGQDRRRAAPRAALLRGDGARAPHSAERRPRRSRAGASNTRPAAHRTRAARGDPAACDRMASAIDTLLVSARAPGPRGSADPAAAVRDAAAAFEPAARAAGVRLTLRDPLRPLRVGADREQVTQALAPLLDNAISHAKANVTVSTAAGGGGHRYRGRGRRRRLRERWSRRDVRAGGQLTRRRGARSAARAASRAVVRWRRRRGAAPGRARFELRLPGTLSSFTS